MHLSNTRVYSYYEHYPTRGLRKGKAIAGGYIISHQYVMLSWPGTSAFTLYMVKSCHCYWNIILTLTYAYMNTYKFKECGLYKYLPNACMASNGSYKSTGHSSYHHYSATCSDSVVIRF